MKILTKISNKIKTSARQRSLYKRASLYLVLSAPLGTIFIISNSDMPYLYPIVGVTIILLTVGLTLVNELFNKILKLNKQIESLEKLNEDTIKACHSFIVDMVVELRRPLHGIIGIKELFDVNTLQEEEKSYFEIIDFCSSYMQKQLERIQFYSEAESKQTIFENSPILIKEAIAKTIDKVSSHRENKDLVVNYKIEDNVPVSVTGTSVVLNTLLFEIIENAVKYTYKGSVFIKAKMHEQIDDLIVFSVEDTGPGISKAQQETLFEAFKNDQDDIPWSERSGGLGLCIAKTLCKVVNGTIWLESSKEHGTTFYFTFPIESPEIINNRLKVSNHEAEAIQKPTFFGDDIPKVKSNGAKILVVDDEHFARKVIVSILQKMGYQAEMAINGEAALQKATENKYDLILMDIQMPVMDGWTASKLIMQKSEFHPNIIALTSHTRPADKKMCEDAGMKGFISKPIKKNELKEILKKFDIEKDFEPQKSTENSKKPFEPISNEKKSKSTETSVDFEKLYYYFDKNLDKCTEVLNRSQRSVIKCIEKMESSFQNENYKEMKFQAHHLRGNLAYLMCEEGEELCILMDNELNQNSIELKKVGHLFIRLQEYIHKLVFEINHFIDEKEQFKSDDKIA